MIRRPPRSTRTDTLLPSTTLFRSPAAGSHCCAAKTAPLPGHEYGTAHHNSPQIGPLKVPGHPWDPCLRSTQVRRRSEEHTSELQSLMRISYAVFCLQNNTLATPQAAATNPQEHRQTPTRTTL